MPPPILIRPMHPVPGEGHPVSMRRIIPLLLLLLLAACTHAQKSGSDLTRLKLPDGFHIAVFAEADSARMMVFSPGGVLLVSEADEGKVVALNDVEAIATLPSKEELISKVMFLINCQAQRLATVISAVPRNLAVVVKQVSEQKTA